MIDEQAVIDWVSQMIAHEPHDVEKRHPNYFDYYSRGFYFRTPETSDRLQVVAYFDQDNLGYIGVYGTKEILLSFSPGSSTNFCKMQIDIPDPTMSMREIWRARLLELLQLYGPDRNAWPRLAWESAQT